MMVSRPIEITFIIVLWGGGGGGGVDQCAENDWSAEEISQTALLSYENARWMYYGVNRLRRELLSHGRGHYESK